MAKRIVIENGTRFGKWTVLSEVEPRKEKVDPRRLQRCFKCRCDCGNVVVCLMLGLRSGKSKSCGCGQREAARNNTKHGHVKHPAYKMWRRMIDRCSEKYHGRHRYFDRGIKICPEWSDVSVFCEWADLQGYKKDSGVQLDRIDNDLIGDRAYSPENCRLVSVAVNSRNKCTSRWWFVKGKRYGSCRQAANAIGVSESKLTYWAISAKTVNPDIGECWTALKYPQ